MADAMVDRRPAARFFCHRCNIEFEDILQDYVCPYCASGFIEQLEGDADGSLLADDVSDADMSNLDDSDEMHQHSGHPMLNDLAFLMSGGGRLRGTARPESLLEQLVWTIGGGAPGGSLGGAGAPFVLVGAPGDYVFGGEGSLDAVVTQLLGQLENAGPPPLSREHIAAIPTQQVTGDEVGADSSCSICWDNFQQGEKISKLDCEHIFHTSCIEPWLQLHATCPICRRSLLPEEPPAPAPAPAPAEATNGTGNTQPRSVPRVLLRRLPASARRLVSGLQQTWDSPADSSSSSSSIMSTGSSVTAAGVWAPRTTNSSSSTNGNSSSSEHDRTQSYNMDIDFD
ncbi:E3 ubiquitin-protein ligase RNF115 isoform X2 [Plutella xylostella]|uniref:E3 ubiquitin-protein ligase RNF115 isoform X2 n=1 Tax=Plutella xylostella TaxID=51655 RepID=UPI0020330D60|nr:E3 ubiquitin-protein ligase RNF115 isoform X2 [Plutella xylostella]